MRRPKENRRIWKSFFAEVVGTFGLSLIAGGIDIVAHQTKGEVNAVAQALAPALTILGLIYSLGSISGAHFNPIVTLSFALHKAFPWRLVPLYWLAEFLGAILAGALLFWGFGSEAKWAVNDPHTNLALAFTVEMVLSFFLVLVILSTAEQHFILGPSAGLPVAAMLTSLSLVGLKLTGPSLNPARSIGPAIITGKTSHLALYIIGPVLGGILATGFVRVVHGSCNTGEQKAAKGKPTH